MLSLYYVDSVHKILLIFIKFIEKYAHVRIIIDILITHICILFFLSIALLVGVRFIYVTVKNQQMYAIFKLPEAEYSITSYKWKKWQRKNQKEKEMICKQMYFDFLMTSLLMSKQIFLTNLMLGVGLFMVEIKM